MATFLAATAMGQSPALSDATRSIKVKERDRIRAQRIDLTKSGRMVEALKALTREIALTRELSGPLSEEVADLIRRRADIQSERGDWADARKSLEEMISIREKQPDRKGWLVGDARRALAELNRVAALPPAQLQRLREADRLDGVRTDLAGKNKIAEAIDPCRKALEIRREVLGENYSDTIRSLKDLGLLYQNTADYPRAETTLRRVAEVTRKTLGEEHPDYATCMNILGSLALGTGNFAEAEPLLRKGLEIRGRTIGESQTLYAASLQQLGALYRATGEYAKAEPLLRRAIAIDKAALGEEHPIYATRLNHLGLLYQTMSDYAKAEPFYRQALEVRKRALGEADPLYGQSLNNLGLLYQSMGDYAKAEPLGRQAVDIAKRTVGETHPEYATNLNNLGLCYSSMGDYAKAEPLFRQALEIQKRALGESHPSLAKSLNNLGSLYRSKGEPAKAEPLYRQSLEMRKRTLGENHPDYAQGLNNLGLLYQKLGEPAKGEPMLRQALEIRKRVLGEGHPDHAASLKNLASIYYSQGQLARAESMAGQALEIQARWARDGIAAFGERQRIAVLTQQGDDLMFYLSVASAAGVKPEELYRRVLGWKGIAEARQHEDRLARDRPELRDALAQLAQARSALARLALQSPSPSRREAWRRQLDELVDRKERLEGELSRKSRSFAKQSSGLGAAEVIAALPPGTSFVDFLEYDHASPAPSGRGSLRFERRLVAFVLAPGRSTTFVPLGASGPVSTAVLAWRKAIEDDQQRKMQAADLHRTMQAAALDVSRRVWNPIKPHLAGASQVLVAPDGVLASFPLAALPGARPGTFLIEDLAIGHVGSGHQVVEAFEAAAPAQGDRPGPRASGLLAVGGIDYLASPGAAAPTHQSESPSGANLSILPGTVPVFGPLAGTGPEAQEVSKRFVQAFPGEPSLVLTGAGATEGALKQQIEGKHWRYLHLATHGFFESPERVAALRAGMAIEAPDPGEVDDASDSPTMTPLLHSGVALAGASRRSKGESPGPDSGVAAEEDGILTAEEVQSLDLRGTELVLLSACETGLGKSYSGQGVLGLQRAVQAAGARSVVASLWKVSDSATTLLMERFYANLWSGKMTKLEALRQAQISIVYAGGEPRPGMTPPPKVNPSLWAAFILAGDTR